METLITKHEAAKIIGIRPSTLSHWRREKKLIEGIHFVRFNSRVVRYIHEALKDWAVNYQHTVED